MKLRTMKQWNKRGLWIITGSKAKGFTKNGKALFSKDQTARPLTREERWGNKTSHGEFIDCFGEDHSDFADLPCGY